MPFNPIVLTVTEVGQTLFRRRIACTYARPTPSNRRSPTVRHRTQTKGCGSRVTTMTMVFKLATQAGRHWRRLNSYELITHLVDSDTFADGEL